MKKVMKKFNRALSIMLVAAMVLTMAPQTAMPVLAAEPEVEAQVLEPVADTTGDDAISEEGDETPVVDDEESEDVTESKDSETGDEEKSEEDKITDDIDNPTSSDDPEKIDSGDEDSAPQTKEPEQEQEDDSVLTANDPGAMETAEDVKVIETQTVVGDDGKTTYENLSDATIYYEDNCVENGLVKANGTKIAFTVVPKAGKKITAVKYFTAESEEKMTGSGTNATAAGSGLNTVYSVNTNISTLAKNKQMVRIAVTVEDVVYHVSFTDSASGATAWKKHTTGEYAFDQATTNITSGGADVTYGDTLTFAVKGLNKAAKTDVTATSGDGNDLALDGKDVGTDPNAYVEFTLDPAAVAGLTSNADDAITVTLANAAGIDIKASLTGGTEASVSIDGNVTVTNPTLKDTTSTYKGLAITTSTVTYNNEQKVYFAVEVKDEDQYKLVPPTAYFLKTGGGDADRQALTVSPETLRDLDDDAVAVYVIDLSAVNASGTLYVTIGAELDDTKEAVKTVSFAANANAAAVVKDADITAADNNILGKSKTTVDDFYEFDVLAKTGYEVTGIEVETTKIYSDKSTATVTETIGTNGEKLAENDDLYPFDGKKTVRVLFDGEDEADAEAGTPAKTWTTRSVKVTVKTAAQTLAADATVKFLSNGNYGSGTNMSKGAYAFAVKEEENKVTYNEETKTAAVKAGTEYLEFTVTDAETEPTVTVHGQHLAELVEGDGYTYRIPAACLNPSDSVLIVRQAKTVTVNYNGTGTVDVEIADVKEDVDLAGSEASGSVSGYSHKVTGTANVDAEVKISGNIHTGLKSTISAVSYQIGADGAVQNAALKADGSFEFIVKASDNVAVFVDKSTDAKLEVSVGGDPTLPGEDGIYEVSYAAVVTAKILDGSGTAITLLNANVKDGGKNAETTATLNAGRDTATLTFNEKEYNKDLTVTLIALNGETQITKSFTIRTESKVDGVTYDNKKIVDGVLTLDVDTVVETGIIMEAANGKIDNLAVAIVPENAEKATAAQILAAGTGSNGVSASVSNGKLTITAAPSGTNGKGKTNAARIVLVDSNDPEKKVISGSSIMVSTADASVLGKEPVVTTTTTAKKIAVSVSAPDGINMDLNTGSVWYKVEVAKPTVLTGLDQDTKDALTKAFTTYGDGSKITKYLKAKTEKDVEIQVMADEIGTGVNVKAFKGAEVTGFKVTTTLIQTIADVNAGGITSANTITGGKNEAAVDTKAPVYANTEKGKLSVKKGTTTIITGDPREIVVATPSFGDGANYTDVTATFVDTKTGLTHSAPNMSARYDLASNTVRVKFDNQSSNYVNNVNGNYNNLGVKITAVTESTGYGVTAVVPLKVVNGIESISATAQPYVKYVGKKTTFKVGVELNSTSSNSKYAPKTKKVTYEIVPAAGAVLPANIAGKVTVNSSGTVTVSKDFVLDKNTANNKFKVKVSAADYAGNPAYGETAAIEISSESRPMGAMLIMKQGEHGWSDATIAASGANAKLEVTKTSGEYRLVVLKPDVAANKTSYDLTDSNVYVNYNELSITPAKGNISVGSNGDIIVNKLGKASFTATDKSDKKNKINNLKNVQFAATSQNVILRFKQLEDSTPLTESGNVFDAQSIEYTGKATTLFGVDVVVKDKDGNYDTIKVSDAKLSFKKNVKNVTPKNDADWINKYGSVKYDYLIAVNGTPASVVLSRKGQGNTEYTLTNSNVVSKSAPKLANVNKKQKIAATNTANTLTYQVSAKGVSSFEGSYVMLSLDTTKKNPDAAKTAFTVGGEKYLDRAIAIRDGSVFDFKISTNVAGNYYLNAAVGTLSGGVFTQEYADAKITVKVLKPGQVKLTVDGKYNLDPQVASKLPIKYNKDVAAAWFVGSTSDPTKNYAKNAIINNQENHFRDYFEAKKDADGYIATIGIRDDLNAENLAKAVEILKAKKHDDQIGYITVTNGSMRMDVKITLTYKSLEKSLVGKATTGVVKGSNMSVDIKLYNGKEYVAVDDYELVSGDGFVKPKTGFLTVDAEKGIRDIHLTGNNVEAGNRKVTLKVTLKSQHAKANTTVNVTVPIKVEKETVANKVVLTKDAKVWTFTHNDYAGPTGVANTPEQGSWKKDVNYTFKSLLSAPEETPITVTSDKDFVSFKSDVYKTTNQNQVLSVEIDKAKLTAAISKKVKWGGKVTVKATFAYGDAKHPTNLKEDTVKITLTLPTAPNAEVTEADFKAAESSIQNLIDILDRYNKANAPSVVGDALTQYKAASTAEITAKVREKVCGIAGSASVLVTVTPNVTNDYAASYAVTVTDQKTPAKPVYTNTFTVTTEKIVSDVIGSIVTLSTDNWSAVKADAAVKDLFTLTKDTTNAEYAKMIRDILKKKGLITENIGITVKTQNNGFKAPTTTESGYYNVTVTVINKRLAPSVSGYKDDTTVNYAFARMQTADEAKATVNTALTTEATVKKIVDDAWKAVAKPGMKTDSEEFYAEVQKNIIDTANKTLAAGDGTKTGNNNVKAVSIEEGSFTMAVSANGELTAMGYTLILSDETAGAEKSESTLNVTISGQTYAIDSMQTVSAFHGRLASADLTIKYVDTAEKAAEAIKTKILTNESKNPAFDPEDLTVAATDGTFVAPSGSKNGAIAVTIKVKGQDDVTRTNIIILADGKDVLVTIPDTDAEKDAKLAYAKAESQVRAAMNKEALIKKINDAIDAKTTAAINEDDVKVVLEAIAAAALGTDTYEITTSNGSAITAAGSADFTPPTDSSTSWEIPAFKVAITKTSEGVDLPTGKTDIDVPAVRLGKFAKLQSLDEAKAAVTKAVKNGLDIGYIALTPETDLDDGFTNVAALNTAVVKEIEAKKVITNPLITVAAAANTDPAATYAEGTDAEDYIYKMTNWKLKLTLADSDEDVAVSKLNVLKADKTPKVTAINITLVGMAEIAAGNADASRANVAVEGDTIQFAIDYEVETTDPAADIEGFKAVTWTVAKQGGGSAEGVTVEGTDGDYYLNVPLTAVGDANHELFLNVTATAKSVQPGQVAATKTVYLKLKFKPTVTKFEIEGPESIELAADGTNATGAAYKAVVDGYHLATSEKLAKWTGTIVGTGLGVYDPATAGATAVSQATVKFATAVAGTAVDKDYTVIATLDTTAEVDGEKVQTKTVKLVQNADTDAPGIELKVDESVAKLEEVTVDTDSTINRLTVTGKDVTIPLSVVGGEDRTWSYTIADVDSDDLITKYGASESTSANAIKVEKTGKNAKLIITNAVKATDTPDVTTNDDGEVTADTTKKIKITATSAYDAATGKGEVKSEIELALVMKQSVDSMKLYQKDNDTSAVDANAIDGDNGVSMITVTHDGTEGDTIYLQPKFEGAHVDQSDAVDPAKVTYRIRQNPFGSNVVLSQMTAEKKAAKIVIDNAVNESGTIVVEAAYVSGDIKKTASRAIFVNMYGIYTDAAALTDIALANDATESVEKNLSVKNGDTAVTEEITWSLTKTTTGVTLEDATLSVNPKLMSEGSYYITVKAEWYEGNVIKSVEKTIKVSKAAADSGEDDDDEEEVSG